MLYGLITKNSELFTKNSINDFLLDEDKNILWIALNSVGLIKYDIFNDKWETYTNENKYSRNAIDER